jgi:hypothetical protein
MAQTGARGGMEIQDQRSTFDGFISATVWTCTLIAQWVALLTLAFAIGAGWWAGLGAYVGLGVAAGLIFRMPALYWAVQVASWVLLGLGGMIVAAFAGAG